ncbi:MAG: RadC family protein [Flavobacteriales bacterium]|jgi:DNA repair protein RadC
MKNNLTIKCWAEDDRPREKMILKGRSALSDAELLAIILGSGSKQQTAVELAQELLLSAENDLSRFFRISFHELKKFKGVGEAKAVSILAALELGRRRKGSERLERQKITASKQVYQHMRPFLQDLRHEEFYVLLLNRANEILQTRQISIGGMSGTVADGKVIFRNAIESGAHGMILVHNHPSEQLNPSDADRSLTKKMVEFGKYIDLPVLDHVIFTDYGYFSFADNGMIS